MTKEEFIEELWIIINNFNINKSPDTKIHITNLLDKYAKEYICKKKKNLNQFKLIEINNKDGINYKFLINPKKIYFISTTSLYSTDIDLPDKKNPRSVVKSQSILNIHFKNKESMNIYCENQNEVNIIVTELEKLLNYTGVEK